MFEVFAYEQIYFVFWSLITQSLCMMWSRKGCLYWCCWCLCFFLFHCFTVYVLLFLKIVFDKDLFAFFSLFRLGARKKGKIFPKLQLPKKKNVLKMLFIYKFNINYLFCAAHHVSYGLLYHSLFTWIVYTLVCEYSRIAI